MPEEKSQIEEKYKQATEPVKFTEEELKTVEDLKKTYGSIQVQFGQAAISKIKLEEEIDGLNKYAADLRQQFIDAQKKETDFLDSIKEKYGDGELNPETGVFTPITD